MVSDEIHAPLVLPGAEHLSYLALEGTHDHAVALVAASKAFNTAGLRCAQLVVPDALARQRMQGSPMAANDSWSPLGVVAARAAYEYGDPWLASLVERLDQQRTLLGELLDEHLPEVRRWPLEATYLAWLDVAAYGHEEPAGGRARARPGQARARCGLRPGPDRPRTSQHRHQPRAPHGDRASPGVGLDLISPGRARR